MWPVHLATTQQLIPTPTHQSANNFMEERTKPDPVQWYHITLLSTVKQTPIQAIKKGYLSTWTNLTIYLINKHLPPSMATAKGHMHQTRKNINYNKQQDPTKLEKPPMSPLAQRTNTVFTKVIYHKIQTATNLTGKFPVTSNSGNIIYLCYTSEIAILF